MGDSEPRGTSTQTESDKTAHSLSTPSGGASIDRHIVHGVQSSLNEMNKPLQDSLESRMKEIDVNDQQISPTEESVNAFDECLSHSVAAILLSLNITTQPSALLELSRMAEKYISALVSDLHGITQIQRRHYPSVRDVKVLVKRGRLDLADVQSEHSRCREMSSSMKDLTKTIERQSLEAQQEDASLEVANFVSEASSCFFSDVLENITQVVPLRTKRKPFASKWMPRFPPEHTYKASAQFKERVTDPKLIKERLLREGRLGEKALCKLVALETPEKLLAKEDDAVEDISIEDNSVEDNSVEENSGEDNPVEDVKMKDVNDNETKDVKATIENGSHSLNTAPDETIRTAENDETKDETKTETKNETKKFDIAAYATKRLHKLDERTRAFEEKCRSRMEDPLIPVEKHLGSFGPLKVDESLPGLISDLIDKDYGHLLQALRAAEKRKSKRIEDEAKKRRKMQKDFEERHGFTEFNVEEDDAFDQEGDLNFSFDFDDVDQPPDQQVDQPTESREVTEPPEHTISNHPPYIATKLHEQFPSPQNEPDLFEGVSFEDVDGEQ